MLRRKTFGPPSFKTDSIGWNQAWERELADLYGNSTAMPAVLSDNALIKNVNIMNDTSSSTRILQSLPGNENALQSMQVQKRQICELQRDLSLKVGLRYAEDDFEQNWTGKCTQKQREQFLLTGLTTTCNVSPEFESFRRWCPETTLPRMNRSNGQGYLDLVGALVHQEVESVPNDYNLIKNAFWDALVAWSAANSLSPQDPGQAMVLKQLELSRTHFLSMFVWSTLLCFYGESEQHNLVKFGKHSSKQYEELRAMQDPAQPNVLRQFLSERKAAEHTCKCCGLPPSKSGAERLSACAACRAVERDVYYCGRECQTKDWKSGNPPHKSVCGKKGALVDHLLALGPSKEQLASKSPNPGPFVDPPKPGYIRSPALVHQIKLLTKNPGVDYVYIQPYPKEDRGIAFETDMRGELFRILRERAMTSHSPDEVKGMFKLMTRPLAAMGKDAIQRMKCQLKKEYGVDVDAV